LLNGYADQHAYEKGVLDTSVSFAELRERSIINGPARAAAVSPAFSALIREGLPGVKVLPKGNQ